MSTQLTKALEFANYRTTLNNQQAVLRAKTQSLLSYSINGGTFTINMQLINFCKLLLDEEQQEAVLLDIYQNPIKITVQSFYDEIFSRYIEVTNDCYADYEKLRKSRKVHRVLDLNEAGE
jgi:hypothetical protein